MGFVTWCHLPIALLALSVLGTSAAARTVEINACGQDVPAGTSAVVTADLDCTGLPFGSEDRILRIMGRSLKLRGHRLVGVSVVCQATGRNCRVSGPGEIVFGALASPSACLFHPLSSRLTVKDLAITDCVGFGIEVSGAPRVTLRRVVVTRPTLYGVRAGTPTLHLDRVTVSEAHDAGIDGGGVQGRDVTVTDTGFGEDTFFAGIRAGTVSLRRATITGNNVGVLASGTLQLRDSVVVDNLSADVMGHPGLINLVDTQCDRSRAFLSDTPLGLCAID